MASVKRFFFIAFVACPLLITSICYAQEKHSDAIIKPASADDTETHLTDEDFANADSFVDAPGQKDTLALQISGKKKSALLEGDIRGVRKSRERNSAKRLNDPPLYGPDRNAISEPYVLWPQGRIPYTISSRYGPNARKVIAAAMQEYHTKTCIRFVPRTNERDYLFIEPDEGCSSGVGNEGGRQSVSLGEGCLMKGIAMHELMHTTGFFHEQSRADRDDYVTILWDNVEDGMEDNFDKITQEETQHMGGQYDYGSIMHYEGGAFSRDGLPTIIPKQRNAKIGQRVGFSPKDLIKLNSLYKCGQMPTATGTVPQPPPPPPPVAPIAPRGGPIEGEGEDEAGDGRRGGGGWGRGGRGGWGRGGGKGEGIRGVWGWGGMAGGKRGEAGPWNGNEAGDGNDGCRTRGGRVLSPGDEYETRRFVYVCDDSGPSPKLVPTACIHRTPEGIIRVNVNEQETCCGGVILSC